MYARPTVRGGFLAGGVVGAEEPVLHLSLQFRDIAAAGFGDLDGALSWLEAAIRERVNNVVWLKVDPRLDPLRSSPRFIKLLDELRLE